MVPRTGSNEEWAKLEEGVMGVEGWDRSAVDEEVPEFLALPSN